MVDTNMTQPMKFRQLLTNSEDLARQALDTLGLTSQTSGCFSHAIQVPSWGNYRHRPRWNIRWPRSISPQKRGDVQKRGGPHFGLGREERRQET